MEEKTIQAHAVAVGSIEEAPWNVNVMPQEKFTLLVADMMASGPEGTDPIDTCDLGGKRYTVDGAHRLRAAKKLGWEYVYELFHPDIDTEEKARLFNFKRDYERGEIDPFKLGASFKWFQEQGMKLDDIGKRFGLDKSTVSRRISLLGISDIAKPKLASAALPVSALEMLAPLPEPVQLKAAKALEKGGAPTIRELEWKLPRWKEEYEEGIELKKMLDDPAAKVKKCPQCGGAPTRKAPSYYAKDSEKAVSDHTGHMWCLPDGSLPKALREEEAKGQQRKEKKVPQHLKSKRTVKEFLRALDGLVADVLPRFTAFSEIEIEGNLPAKGGSVNLSKASNIFYAEVKGELDGKDARLEIQAQDREDEDPSDAMVRLDVGDKSAVFLSVAASDSEEFGCFVFPDGDVSSEKDLRSLEKSAEDFLERYGAGAKPTRKRGRPKKGAK